MNRQLQILTDFAQSIQDAAGQLGARSKRIYQNDAKMLALWMMEQGLTNETLTRSSMIAYRAYLDSRYEKATAARMLSVARRILHEQVRGKGIPNPADDIKGFALDNESPHIALTKQQAKDLLAFIDRNTVEGKRDYALILFLLRTGIRRTECVSLNIGDFTQEQGHIVATIRHGKGDKRRKVKVPVDVFRAIEDYIQVSGRSVTSLDNPLFVGLGRWQDKRISDKFIERAVRGYSEKLGIHLTPHDLRASFNPGNRGRCYAAPSSVCGRP